MQPIQQPFSQYSDLNGTPLQNGQIFIGVENQNPETNPLVVYWDAAGTQPAAQPLTTLNGYVSRDGTPANIFTNAAFSITVRNKKGCIVYNSLSSAQSGGSVILTFLAQMASSIGSSLIGFIQAGTGAVLRTVQSKLRDTVSVLDFGADATGATDSTAAMQAAHNTGKVIYYPAGIYSFGKITIAAGGIVGDASVISSNVNSGGTILKTTNSPIFNPIGLF